MARERDTQREHEYLWGRQWRRILAESKLRRDGVIQNPLNAEPKVNELLKSDPNYDQVALPNPKLARGSQERGFPTSQLGTSQSGWEQSRRPEQDPSKKTPATPDLSPQQQRYDSLVERLKTEHGLSDEDARVWADMA